MSSETRSKKQKLSVKERIQLFEPDWDKAQLLALLVVIALIFWNLRYAAMAGQLPDITGFCGASCIATVLFQRAFS